MQKIKGKKILKNGAIGLMLNRKMVNGNGEL